MKTSATATATALALALSGARALPLDQRSRTSLDSVSDYKPISFTAITRQNSNQTNGSLIAIDSKSDLLYTTNVTVGGDVFTLQLDTGSSDLWVYAKTRRHFNVTNETDEPLSITYGEGSVRGNIAYTQVSIGNYTIPEQAFLNVEEMQDETISGIFPLGLDGLSEIYDTISQESGANNTSAQSPVINIFQRDPSSPNFIGLALDRTEDGESTSGGVLSISQYDPRFSNITQSAPLPLEPRGTSRWTVGIDHFRLNGKDLSFNSTVASVEPGRGVALIDSGTSLAYVPPAIVDEIYGGIKGSKKYQQNSDTFWLVPCTAGTNISLTFSNQSFIINPLDLTSVQTIQQGGKQYTVCTNTIMSSISGFGGQFDFLLGDVFMRNVYSVFNFGNKINPNSGPSVQMVSRANEQDAYSTFETRRNATLSKSPPVLDPADFQVYGFQL